MAYHVGATVSGADAGTDWLSVPAGGNFDASVGVTGAGTATLQRRLTGGDGTVYDVKAYTVNGASSDAPEIGFAASNWDFRLYVKSGDYTSGSIVLDLWTS
jgi:phage gp45-like